MSITKLVCLGDSLTEGYEIDMNKRWTNQIESKFDFSIINSGISGDTTAGMLARFNTDVVNHSPSHMILMGGTNDLYHDLTTKQILSNIHCISRQAKFHKINIIIGIPTPVIFQNIDYPKSMFLNESQLKERVDTFRKDLKQYALEDDKPTIDFGLNMHGDLFLSDGVHPNEDGQSIMAQNVIESLESIFQLN